MTRRTAILAICLVAVVGLLGLRSWKLALGRVERSAVAAIERKTGFVVKTVERAEFALLPGVWLLVYGAGVVAAGAFSTRVIPVLGAACIGAGAVALFVPQPYGTWSMALAFGLLHVACGIQIARRHGG